MHTCIISRVIYGLLITKIMIALFNMHDKKMSLYYYYCTQCVPYFVFCYTFRHILTAGAMYWSGLVQHHMTCVELT